MRVSVKPKLLQTPAAIWLSDLHLVAGDLSIARRNFAGTIGHRRLCLDDDVFGYSFCCSGLIHYRRGFNSGVRRNSLSDEIVRRAAPEYFEIHRYLWDLADKYVAHSCNEFEQLSVTISVAEGDDGIAAFHGLGRQGSSIELLNEQQITLSVALIDSLNLNYLLPEMTRLEKEIGEFCSTLSSRTKRAA